MDAPKLKRRRFNWVISDIVRKGLQLYLEWSARLKGQRFACRALAGESEYNLTINCDLTVSCNCQDYNASGHIGDLNKNSFDEVFFGPVASRFREELAKGKLPIRSCTRCGDLMRVPKSQVKTVANLRGLAMAGNASQKPGGVISPQPRPNGEITESKLEMFAGPTPRLPYRGMLLE